MLAPVQWKSSSAVVLSSKSTHIFCLELFCTVFDSEWCLICAYFSPDSDQITFSLEKVILWIEDYFSRKQRFEVKKSWWICTNRQFFASQDVNWWIEVVWFTCGLLWCFYKLFGLSFWRHPFTAEDPLVSKWWNATFLQIWWRNKLIYILDGLRVSTFSANLKF